MMPPILIDEQNWREFLPQYTEPDGTQVYEFGGHKRVLNAIPPILAAGEIPGIPGPTADGFTLIPRNEWDDRIAEKDKDQSWLEDIVRGVIPCTDQNGLGFCHAYGTIAIAECQRLMDQFSTPSGALPVGPLPEPPKLEDAP